VNRKADVFTKQWNRMESIRIANWNALVGIPQAPDLTPRRIVKLTHHAAARDWDEVWYLRLPCCYSAPGAETEYCDERVCVCSCLPAIISSELHVRSSLIIFVHATYGRGSVRSSTGGVVTRNVFPVLWVTSYLLISQACLKSPPSWSAVHTQPWAWL